VLGWGWEISAGAKKKESGQLFAAVVISRLLLPASPISDYFVADSE
jgi:hypothetical protein